MPEPTPPAFDEWCLVELMGHRKVAARVTEQTVAGMGFLRLDEPDGRSQLVNPSSVYALHPTTEEIVTAMANRWRTAPVNRWELEAASGPVEGLATTAGRPVECEDDDPWGVREEAPF